jgi:hypothetical protein
MPHPKNRMKLTGDTHLPDVRDYGDYDDVDVLALDVGSEPRVYADGYVPASLDESMAARESIAPQEHEGALAAVEHKAEKVTAKSPWLAAGAALAVGWLVARMLRR